MFVPSTRRELPDHFLALANPTRLRILQRLGEVGEESVNDLAAAMRMSQPRISWHLRMLRVGGVIRTRREGRQMYCSLDVENIARERRQLEELLGIKDRVKVRTEVGT
jgi:DNA-binding transcriptional ArsR family regulator